ncbi:MAG: hypothetical protein WA021_03860 [Minisyncoccia bacterium]
MFWTSLFKKKDVRPNTGTLHAIFDSGSNTLVTIGRYPPALMLLAESLLDTIYVPTIEAENVEKLLAARPSSYPEWSWRGGNNFRATNPAIITDEMRKRAVFANKKLAIFAHAIYLMNRLRDKVHTGVHGQEMVYAQKREQAQAVKDVVGDKAVHAPYVVQHAEDTGLTLLQAADDILFQAQLDAEYLEKTERVRIALFKKIKRAQTARELDEIIRNYYRDGTV